VTECVKKLGKEQNRKKVNSIDYGLRTVTGGHGSNGEGGRGAGFGMAVGQQGGAASRIAPHLPGFILARGVADGSTLNGCVAY
jgi:hypothetical protein